MPFKNPEDKKRWQNNYYHINGLKEVQTNRARLNYWIKKYCKLAKITKQEFKLSFRSSWDEERLKENYKELDLTIHLNKEHH